MTFSSFYLSLCLGFGFYQQALIMGTVSGVTGQLGSIAGCTPADCCSQIDAIKGELARVNSRLAAVEGGNGKADNALQVAQKALDQALGAKAQASDFAAEIGGLHDDFFGLEATLAGLAPAIAAAAALAARAIGLIEALSAAVAPLLAALPAILVAIGAAVTVAAIQTQLNTVERVADTAFAVANDAFSRAVSALFNAGIAQRAADAAAGVANAATDLGNRALSGLTALTSRVGTVESVASGAKATADRAVAGVGALGGRVSNVESVASGAKATADRAVAGVGALGGRVGAVESVASGAKATADRAISGVEALGGRVGAVESVASGAKATADRAIDIAQAAAIRQGIAGRDGANGKDGVNGKDADTAPVVTALTSRVGALENRVGAITTTQPNTVNPGKEDEIIRLLQGTRFDVLALPAALVANPTYRAAITSAAAVGSCQSSRPGGCPGGTPDRFNSLDSRLNGISSAFGALNNAVLGTITSTLNVINTKLGSQITGGLSAWSASIAEVVNRSQILNILTYISVLHNAYFLSNSLAQTLFSAVSNSLAALGIKDTSKDPAGTPFNIGKIVGDWTEGFFKATFGVATVEGIKADWKKYSRIYQAAAQVMYSVQSIGHSILGALEVVGSHVSKIGNALQKFRAVGEKAYGWMNPQPFFQNRFFTGLQATQEVVSQVDQVASEVLSVQETITQLGKNKDDLTKSVGEDPSGKKADVTPEAAQVKVTEDAAKTASKSPEIPESSQVKP